jgi:hypothetical protein
MLIERWERFRGVDRWPEVLAVITDKKSSYMPSRVGPSRFLTWITVDYRGSDGVLRSKTIRYWMTRCSFGVGDQFYLRCSPADQSKIYFRESAQDNLLAALGVPVVAFIVWLCERYR